MFSKRISKVVGVLLIAIIASFTLVACSGTGTGVAGGAIRGVVHEGVYQNCDTGKKVSAAGKSIEIDGIEIKLPVDWNYANTEMGGTFNGANWDKDDAARGIGSFNACEEGDGSESYKNAYSVNMRWEYITYGSTHGTYPVHANYKGTDSTGTYNVGGTDESCVSGGGLISSSINKEAGNGDFMGYLTALSKCKILLYYPKTGKACVCAPGFYAYGENDISAGGFNWGGAPLACMGGFSEAVGNALSSTGNDWAELQPRADDCPIVECYFVDPDTELGPCEFDGAKFSSGSKSKSKGCKGSVNAGGNSSIAEAAVTVAYDPRDRGKFPEENKGCGYPCSDSSAIVGYYQLCKDVNLDHGGNPYVCECSTLSPVAARWAGADDEIPTYTGAIITHCEHSDHWDKIGTLFGDKAVSDLQPGDILVNDVHTWVYTGNEEIRKKFPDSDADCVSASLGDHAPEIENASGYSYAKWNIYRNVKPEENSKYKDVKLGS